jgi:hypothetical protein
MIECRVVSVSGPNDPNEIELGHCTFPVPPLGVVKWGDELYSVLGQRWEASTGTAAMLVIALMKQSLITKVLEAPAGGGLVLPGLGGGRRRN